MVCDGDDGDEGVGGGGNGGGIGNGDNGGDDSLDDASGGVDSDSQLHSGRKQYEDLKSFSRVCGKDLHAELTNGPLQKTSI